MLTICTNASCIKVFRRSRWSAVELPPRKPHWLTWKTCPFPGNARGVEQWVPHRFLQNSLWERGSGISLVKRGPYWVSAERLCVLFFNPPPQWGKQHISQKWKKTNKQLRDWADKWFSISQWLLSSPGANYFLTLSDTWSLHSVNGLLYVASWAPDSKTE